jgi:hypothetical protein
MRLRKTVRLNGTDYQIDSEKIVRLASRLEPKAIDKYWAKIQGRRFPPKQIVSELLGVPLVDFTTMDASRILSAVGLQVQSANVKPEPARTQSETLLPEYFRAHGLTDIEVESAIENSNNRPDYRLRADGTEVLLEVEDFSAKSEDLRVRGGTYNPYGPVREKISAARKKFKDMEGHCCCLVLQNQEKQRIGLNWQIVIGAMLSDLGVPLSASNITGQAEISKTEPVAQGDRGTNEHLAIAPENAIVSAIIVVERYAIGEKRFRLFVHEREQELGRELGVEEYLQAVEQSAGTQRDLSLNRIRVRVHENPYAGVPLDRRLFRGPFDQRYGVVEGQNRWGQVYTGRGVAEFEELSAAAKLLSRS